MWTLWFSLTIAPGKMGEGYLSRSRATDYDVLCIRVPWMPATC